ncbi:hypothetical protein N7516_002490 [Penicillium verrucosum]|uniref:uncharacterized protein n=1 Tax=Penicillium verrucosum TaxID=60171 RepID=UPI00254591F6|nr:uncharacterized protein N7516_002490 [Penicillium verrucosum]KAJ5942322.1 hypothetical protein N7516_002490 [Penicillium verrucosum]
MPPLFPLLRMGGSGVHFTPTKEHMQSVMKQTQQLQTLAARQVQQSTQQFMMQQPQRSQTVAVQRVQQPTQQMQAAFPTTPDEHMQYVI